MSARIPLPVDDVVPEVLSTLAQHGSALLIAPPGSGKTTRVAPAVLDDPRFEGETWLLQPRRLAVQLSASRIAEEDATRVGGRIGYRIRFERRTSKETRLLVCTEGVLLARLQQDPTLEGIGTVIFDEFHERSLEADLSLALARRVQEALRPDLKILVMSATLDADPIARWLTRDSDGANEPDVEAAPVIRTGGRPYPVTVRYAAPKDETRYLDGVVDALPGALEGGKGDVLVFLPGLGEIQRVAQGIRQRRSLKALDVALLHGRMLAEEQALALRAQGPRRIILATNVAETSLTLPRVDTVVDAGRVRVKRFDPVTGLDHLVTERAPRSSLEQRAGRAGRVRAGTCVRVFHEAHARHATAQPEPAILRIDVSSALLQLRAWGERDVSAFPFVTTPTPRAMETALRTLARLGAIDSPEPGGVTPTGQFMAQLPLNPRLARLVLEGIQRSTKDLAYATAAILEDGDLLRGSRRRDPAACDMRVALDALDHGRSPAAKRALRVAAQLARLAPRAPLPVASGTRPTSRGGDERSALGHLLLAAFPDRVARRRTQDPERAVMVGGRGLICPPHVGAREAALFVALALAGRDMGAGKGEAKVFAASPVEQAWLPESEIDEVITHAWDTDRERPRGWRELRYLDLVLARKECPLDPHAARDALRARALEDLEDALGLSRDAFQLFRARLNFVNEHVPGVGLPTLDTAYLGDVLDGLLYKHKTLGSLRSAPVIDMCMGTLSYAARQALDQHAPTHLTVPSGSRIALTWRDGEPPILAVRIQELFGLTETPTVAAGRVPVLLHLLAPNYRVQQITQDLAGFWERGYPQVRKDLRGRYPKHAWPEDGRTATPLRGAKRRPRRS